MYLDIISNKLFKTMPRKLTQYDGIGYGHDTSQRAEGGNQ